MSCDPEITPEPRPRAEVLKRPRHPGTPRLDFVTLILFVCCCCFLLDGARVSWRRGQPSGDQGVPAGWRCEAADRDDARRTPATLGAQVVTAKQNQFLKKEKPKAKIEESKKKPSKDPLQVKMFQRN